MSQVRYRSFAGVLAGAYLTGQTHRALIHAVERDAESNAVVRVLCGRVSLENMSDDTYAPGAAGPATCSRCLATAEREDQAGERPPDEPGYTLYAKLNHNRFGDSYVWCYRKLGR